MSAWHVRVAQQAEQDIVAILKWIADQFGSQQVDMYSETLTLSLTALFEGPTLQDVRARDDIQPDLLTLHVARQGRCGRHFVVFQIDNDHHCIDVLRVLHDSMDLQRHVGDKGKRLL